MVKNEAKEKKLLEQYFLNGYPDEDRTVIFDARWSLGTYNQYLER